MNEDELQDALDRLAPEVGTSAPSAERLVQEGRRVRRRRRRVGAVLVSVAAVLVVGVLGSRALTTPSTEPAPAAPAPDGERAAALDQLSTKDQELAHRLDEARAAQSQGGTPAAEAAGAVAALALGADPDVPWADTVRFTIVATPVARIDADRADRRDAWEGCPPTPYASQGTYEGRDCPVSPLATISALVAEGGSIVYDPRPPGPSIGCNVYVLPNDEPGRTVWIRPDEAHRDCFSDFAVAVTTDDAGRVTQVDLALSGP